MSIRKERCEHKEGEITHEQGRRDHTLLTERGKPTTHDLSFSARPTAVRGGEGGGAGLSVPRHVVPLTGRPHGDSIGAHSISIAVTAVSIVPSITSCPHEY